MSSNKRYRISKTTASDPNITDETEVAWKVVANFEVPSSYKFGSPTTAYGTANKNYDPVRKKNGVLYKDKWPITQKQRGRAATDCLNIWKWYYQYEEKST